MPVPRRESHSAEMMDRIRDEPNACPLSGFFFADCIPAFPAQDLSGEDTFFCSRRMREWIF